MYNKYFFLHIPKAAGTSLFKVFNEILGSENVKQVVSLNKGPKQLETLNEYKLVGGHFTYYDYLKFINDDRYSITFLRNPIERFLSQYYFFKNNVGDIKQPSVVNAKKLDLKSYVEYYGNKQMYGDVLNRQVWHLVGLQKPTITDNEVLELAKENLSKINFIGIHENLAESIDLLCYDCNWPLIRDIPVINVTNKKPVYSEVDKNTLERIKELNYLDFQLYDYALELYNSKKRQILQEAIKVNYKISHSNSEEVLNLKRNIIVSLHKDNERNVCMENKIGSNINCGTGEIKITSARVYNNTDGSIVIKSGREAFIEIIYKSSITVENVVVGFVIEDEYGQKIYGTNSLLLNQIIPVQKDETYCVIYKLNMNIAEGRYNLNVALHSDKCYSLSTSLEDNFHKFLDVHLDECYDNCNNITDFVVSEINGTVFEGVAKLEPSLLSRKIEIMDKVDKKTTDKIYLNIKEVPREVEVKSMFFCNIDIMNCTSKIINSTGENPIHIAYHWLNENNNTIIHFEGERSTIAPSLLPFNHNEYKLRVRSPEKSGKYKLRVTLVQEGVVWLDELNFCLPKDAIIEIKDLNHTCIDDDILSCGRNSLEMQSTQKLNKFALFVKKLSSR